ncbi:MAG TPA: DUF4258 domain-containing protein [Chroococcales cyanobacterium]|jgi:hypothetical protein
MRNEGRPIEFGKHAVKRLKGREISESDAVQIIRHGAIRPDGDCDFIAFGSFNGRQLEAACLDLGDHIFVKTVYWEGGCDAV